MVLCCMIIFIYLFLSNDNGHLGNLREFDKGSLISVCRTEGKSAQFAKDKLDFGTLYCKDTIYNFKLHEVLYSKSKQILTKDLCAN